MQEALAWPAQGLFTIPAYFDYAATVTWALSGAVVGVRRSYDIVGVFVVALLSSMGGGLLRDGILLQRTPAFLTDGTYLILIATVTVLVAVNNRWLKLVPRRTTVDTAVGWMDAVGIPAYAVVGMQLAAAQGLPVPGVVLVGLVNGVGGGLLRDVVVDDPRRLLQPGQFEALVVLLACLTFVLLTRSLALHPMPAGWITMVLFVMVRALVIRFNWKTSALRPIEDRETDR